MSLSSQDSERSRSQRGEMGEASGRVLFFRNVALGVAVFLAGHTVYSNLMRLVGTDPFISFRQANDLGLSDSVGIRFNGVRLKAYRLGKLVTSATVDRLDVSKDRQSFELVGIHDGTYRTQSDSFGYSASAGTYMALPRILSVTGGVRVRGAHLDISTEGARFDANHDILRTDQPVSGRLYDGTIRATNLVLNTKSQDYDAGPSEYHGSLTMLRRDPADDNTPIMRRWDISTDHTKKSGHFRYFTNAVANDGEVLIKADLLQWDLQTDVITALGNVFYFSGKADITGDKATLYHKERRVILYGNVTMYVKPKSEANKPPVIEPIPQLKSSMPDEIKPDSPGTASSDPDQKKLNDSLRNGKSLRQYPLLTTCHQIEYWYEKGKRHAHITGAPQGRQELPSSRWRYVWATVGEYDGENDQLLLESSPGKSDVRMKNSIGDDLTAKNLRVSTKDDAEENDYSGEDVKGQVYSDSDEDPRDKKTKSPKTGPGTGPATGKPPLHGPGQPGAGPMS